MFFVAYGVTKKLEKASWIRFKFTYVEGSYDVHEISLRRKSEIKCKNYHKNENNPRLYDLAGQYLASV